MLSKLSKTNKLVKLPKFVYNKPIICYSTQQIPNNTETSIKEDLKIIYNKLSSKVTAHTSVFDKHMVSFFKNTFDTNSRYLGISIVLAICGIVFGLLHMVYGVFFGDGYSSEIPETILKGLGWTVVFAVCAFIWPLVLLGTAGALFRKYRHNKKNHTKNYEDYC